MPDQTAPLPHDRAAELAVLGAVLLDPRQLDSVRQVLAPTDFYDARHRWIFDAVCSLDTDNEPVDVVTLRSRLDRDGRLETVGGPAFLAELFDGLALSTNAGDYARLVRGHSLARRLHRYGSRIAADAPRREPAALLEDAERTLFSIAEGLQTNAPVPVGETTDALAQEAQEYREALPGIETGLPELDRLMGGLRPSDLVLLGARPGEGKTSLALNVTLDAALRGARVLVFSLEMSLRQIGIRLLFSHARVDARPLAERGIYSADDRKKIRNANESLRRLPIRVDDSPVTPVELRSKARQLRRDPGLDLIVVDYLQLMRAGDDGRRRFENRNLEIADISRSLKLLAKELDVPVLALSQLSRAPEQRDAAAPRLSDLRESGSLEQDADIVLFLHRERRPAPRANENGAPAEPGPPTRRVTVAKNRNGPTGSIQLAWLDRFTRFASIAELDSTPTPDGRDDWEDDEASEAAPDNHTPPGGPPDPAPEVGF